MSILIGIVFVAVFVGTFVLAWVVFPHFVSVSEQLHKSKAEILFKRFYVSGSIAIFVCFCLSDLTKHKESETKSAESISSVPVASENESVVDTSTSSSNSENDAVSTIAPEPETNSPQNEQMAPAFVQVPINHAATSMPTAQNSLPQTVAVADVANSAADSNQVNTIDPLNDTRPIHASDQAINPLNDTRPIH